MGKVTGKRLLLIGALLILLGAIGSNSDIPWGGIGGWLLMGIGFVVTIAGTAKRTGEKKAEQK